MVDLLSRSKLHALFLSACGSVPRTKEAAQGTCMYEGSDYMGTLSCPVPTATAVPRRIMKISAKGAVLTRTRGVSCRPMTHSFNLRPRTRRRFQTDRTSCLDDPDYMRASPTPPEIISPSVPVGCQTLHRQRQPHQQGIGDGQRQAGQACKPVVRRGCQRGSVWLQTQSDLIRL